MVLGGDGGAWWCQVVPGGARWCQVVPGGARFHSAVLHLFHGAAPFPQRCTFFCIAANYQGCSLHPLEFASRINAREDLDSPMSIEARIDAKAVEFVRAV